MEQSNTKTWQIVVGLLVIVAIAWILIKTPEPAPVPTNTDVADTNPDPLEDLNINSEQLCYIWNTEAGDKAQLSMDIRGGDVVGEFNWLPVEKDKKTGIFIGSVTGTGADRVVNAWWQASAEGMSNQEQIIIKFGGGIATVGFGEMKELEDGRWAYADPSRLSFAPNLSGTDCGDSAMD